MEPQLNDVRIVHLPPTTVIASHAFGTGPEDQAWAKIRAFLAATDLLTRYPATRAFGFDAPAPSAQEASRTDAEEYGYEVWVTVPTEAAAELLANAQQNTSSETPDISDLTVKTMPGGTYAAHMIAMGDFHEWNLLENWVATSPDWEYAGQGSPDNMFDALEETLNLPAAIAASGTDNWQLDCLTPVRLKSVAKPGIVNLPEFTVNGYRLETTVAAAMQAIPPFWAQLSSDGRMDRLINARIENACPAGVLGLAVCTAAERGEDAMDYYAGVLREDSTPEEGLVSLRVPASSWAVFRTQSPDPLAMQQLIRDSHRWLASSDYQTGDAPQIEAYESPTALTLYIPLTA